MSRGPEGPGCKWVCDTIGCFFCCFFWFVCVGFSFVFWVGGGGGGTHCSLSMDPDGLATPVLTPVTTVYYRNRPIKKPNF